MGIRCEPIQVFPAQQPNRVLINKPPGIRLIIPEEVVMQPRFTVGILVLQAEQEGTHGKIHAELAAFTGDFVDVHDGFFVEMSIDKNGCVLLVRTLHVK